VATSKKTIESDNPASALYVPASAQNAYRWALAQRAEQSKESARHGIRESLYAPQSMRLIGSLLYMEASGQDFRTLWGESIPAAAADKPEPKTPPKSAEDLAAELIVTDKERASALLAHASVLDWTREHIRQERESAERREHDRIKNTCPICKEHAPAIPKRRVSLSALANDTEGPFITACPTCISIARYEYRAMQALQLVQDSAGGSVTIREAILSALGSARGATEAAA